ncbi:MAG: hypothetical protein J6W74_05910 [Bacteroidales bacterium]|nr:hypothetical protein [Bacteroidales bacterium]
MKRILTTIALSLLALCAAAQSTSQIKSYSFTNSEGKMYYAVRYEYNPDGTIARETRQHLSWGITETFYYSYDAETRTVRVTSSDSPDYLEVYYFLPTYSALGTHEPWTCATYNQILEWGDDNLGAMSHFLYSDGRIYYASGESFSSNIVDYITFVWNENDTLASIRMVNDYEEMTIDGFKYSGDPDPFKGMRVNPVYAILLPELTEWKNGMAGYFSPYQLNGFTQTSDIDDKEVITIDYKKDLSGRVVRMDLKNAGKPYIVVQITY